MNKKHAFREKNVSLIILYDSENRMLLQHRTSNAEIMPDYWAFFGGGIRKEETPEAALLRESLEELNFEPEVPELFTEQSFTEGNIGGILYVFIEPYNGDKSRLELNEGQGWGWYTSAETDPLKMIGRDRILVKKIGEHISK